VLTMGPVRRLLMLGLVVRMFTQYYRMTDHYWSHGTVMLLGFDPFQSLPNL